MLKLVKKIWDLIKKKYHENEEIYNYIFSGIFGVFVSIFSYAFCSTLIRLNIILSNTISWVIAVISMYITNKIFVFKTKCKNKKELFKEFCSFITARLMTLFIETIILFIGAECFEVNDIIVKSLSQIVVIILNYVFSKLIVFKENKE